MRSRKEIEKDIRFGTSGEMRGVGQQLGSDILDLAIYQPGLDKCIAQLLADLARQERLEEAKWWYEWFFGEPQSGKLGIERLEEAQDRLAALSAPAKVQAEFCKHCGAGIGKFRRVGEGTCPKCDPAPAKERER